MLTHRPLAIAALATLLFASPRANADERKKYELYHPIKTDAQGNVIPWFTPDLGKAYDHGIRAVWKWWLAMEPDPRDPKGIPYYMLHQVWRPGPDYDARGLGGDQIAMALSSWNLLSDYLGDPAVVENMRLMADLVLKNGFSRPGDAWPNLPFPYNTKRFTGVYDGIMMNGGPGYTEPDKAGSLASELVVLHKKTGERRYLDAAVKIADVLARKTAEGDAHVSPMPYRVRVRDGAVSAPYTTNWVGTLRLFEDLIALRKGNVAAYRKAHAELTRWLKAYPLKNNRWGPFFEDIPTWSDTQINAVTLAMYILDRREAWSPTWREDARGCLDWAWKALGNETWKKYGVTVMNEQTAYRVPGNSHTSRQSSMELRYAELTGDTSRKTNAVRGLSWATYHIDHDGKNRYYHDDIWLTDGYGDFVRHYLRAMAAAPELAPSGQDHLLRASSVVKAVRYGAGELAYTTFDRASTELLRIDTFDPAEVKAGGVALRRLSTVDELASTEGYTVGAPGDLPTVVRVHHKRSGDVTISGRPRKLAQN